MDRFIRTLAPLAWLAAAAAVAPPGTARAAEGAASPARPESAVTFGGGYLFDNNPRFGQYTGLRDRGAYGLLDISMIKRDDDAGTWLGVTGRNLGLEHRDLRLEYQRQGSWSSFIEFGQTPRYIPYTVSTSLAGIGTGTQTVNGPGGTSRIFDDLKTRRDKWGAGFDKIIAGGFDVRVRYSTEEKTGSRLFGQGEVPGGPATFFLLDPIDYTTRQAEGSFAYTGERFQVTGGYHGTVFDNNITALNVTGGFFSPIALPPGTQSHQLYLTGGYDFTQTARGTFDVASMRATQTEAFVVPSPTGRGDLGAKVDTTHVKLGLSARPLPRLSLNAHLRYADRNDRTPVIQYGPSLPGATTDGSNEPRSIETTTARVEAGYQLPRGFRLTGGAEYEEKNRATYPIRLVSQRDQTVEKSYRLELRRSLSATVNGAASYVHSERDGSPFLANVLNLSLTPGSNLVAPLHFADRDRDKLRLTLGWAPSEPLTLQFSLDDARDSYHARTAAALGPRAGTARNYTLDAGYSFSQAWQATAWLSRNATRAEQATLTSTDIWAADLRNISDSFGLGLRGKPVSRIDIGADLLYTSITDESRLTAITGPAIASLPDITTRLTTLKLWGKYALQKNTGVRLDYLYDRWRSNDWTWTSWVYTDGTRVIQGPAQTVHFIGLSGYYKWQ